MPNTKKKKEEKTQKNRMHRKFKTDMRNRISIRNINN